jgi:hypothetical protein
MDALAQSPHRDAGHATTPDHPTCALATDAQGTTLTLRGEPGAARAGVRLCRVYWMECGIETPLGDALKVLRMLSQVAHRPFGVADLRDLRVRFEPNADRNR